MKYFHAFLGLDNTLPPANPVAQIASDPSQNDDFTLSCEFTSPDMNGTLQASVEWFIGDNVVEVTDMFTDTPNQDNTVYMNKSVLTNLAYGTEVNHSNIYLLYIYTSCFKL